MGYSLRVDRYRYTEWREWSTGPVHATELYDCTLDSDEIANVAGLDKYAPVVSARPAQLARQLPLRAGPTK